jgi:hypothetical protein
MVVAKDRPVRLTALAARSAATACNICGGQNFAPGPGGRLAAFGKPPKCVRCGSLERHRVLHRIFTTIPETATAPFHAFQVSPNFSVDRKRFRGVASTGAPPLKPPPETRGKYGWAFSFYAEAPDMRGFFQELFALLEPPGIMGVAVAGAFFRHATSEQKNADGKVTWRYGADFGDHLRQILGQVYVLEVAGADPCTAALDGAFFVSRQEKRINSLADVLARENFFSHLMDPKKFVAK